MKTDNLVSALRLSVYDGTPAEIIAPYRPVRAIKTAWIPQTMGEQVWALFMFETESDRLAWEQCLPDVLQKSLDRNLIEYARKYGWHIRDWNGFVLGDK